MRLGVRVMACCCCCVVVVLLLLLLAIAAAKDLYVAILATGSVTLFNLLLIFHALSQLIIVIITMTIVNGDE